MPLGVLDVVVETTALQTLLQRLVVMTVGTQLYSQVVVWVRESLADRVLDPLNQHVKLILQITLTLKLLSERLNNEW
jgi:hypothetical protein